jgi:transposase-like protein
MPISVEPRRWRCPACKTSLTVPTDGPRPKTVYRCPTCRLELVADFETRIFVVRPLAEGDER